MLILLHAVWFQYMLTSFVHPEQGSLEQRKPETIKLNRHVFPIIWENVRIQWLEKIFGVHRFVMGL